MHRARFSSLIAVSALLSVPALAKDGDQPLTGSFAPTQIHKLEAASKATALARVRLGFAPMVLIDQAGFDAVHYEIKLAIDEEALEVLGQVTMTARTRAAGFDSPNLNLLDELIVDSVKSGGQGISWYHGGDFVHATLPQPKDLDEEFQVTIYYHGHPPEGGFQGFLFGSHLGVPMISTLSEPYMAQSWWPCKDTPSDKADSVDMRVTVNSSLYAVSNGLLRDSTDNGDGTTTYHWHEAYPITTYLVSLAITNFARFTEWYHHGADSMPVMFYSYPENLSSAETWWPISVSQIGAFAQIFGEYPFVNEKYGIAHFTWGGAMEHQTVSSHTSSTFGFDQYVTAHELAHQWWGDMVTCRDWHHIWLNEGFASYSEALWAEHNGGISAYRSYMNSMQYWQGGRIYIDDTTSVWNIFSTRVYDKGAWVLHMLRGMLSDSVFFDVLRAYYDHPNHQYKDAVTEDFRDLAEAVAGQDLDWFFEDWVYGYYYPKYYYSWASRSRVDGRYNLFVHLRQTQTTSPQVFRMPVDLVLAVGSARDTVRVWNDARDRDYWFVTDAPASISQLDPLDWILDQSYPEPYGLQIVSETLQTVDQFADHVDSVIAICGDPGAAISYSIAAGALPAGLELDSLTGLIGGRSLSASSTEVTIRAAALGYQPATRTYSIAVTPAPYIPGDQNADGTLDIRDAVELIDYVFRGGFAPTPLNAADPSGDCVADVADVVTLIEHVFRGGPIPWLGCLE